MSLSNNIVFVHIPKAGGTSIRKFMTSQVADEDIFPESDLHHFPKYTSLNVTRPMLFMSHLGFDFVCSAQADAFVLMRHPIDRVLSLYSYAMYPGKNVPIIGADWVKGLSFEEFFTTAVAPIRMNVDNAQVWQIASSYSDRHRQLRLARGVTYEQIISEAKKNLSKSAVVGTLEDMPKFYKGVAEYFGCTDADIPQQASNVSEKRVQWVDLSDAQKKLVEACVVNEWGVYDYAKSIADARS